MGDRPLLIDVLEDRRRLAYCLAGALAVHALGVTLRYWHPRRPVDEPPPPAPMVVPVSLEGAAPEPDPPPPPPAPVPPAPAAVSPPPAEREALALVPKPKPRREPTPEPKPPERPHPKPRPSAEAPEVAAREDVAPGEDATVFGGRDGAFMALVCFLPRHTKSARDVRDCKPVASFRTNEINVSPRRFRRGFPGVERRVEWFGIDYRGRFKVKTAGYYAFRLVSDDGSVLLIDGVEVLDNDGTHSPREAKFAMPLSAGEHDMQLLYYQGPGKRLALQLFVKAYKKDEKPFGPEL